MWNGLKGLLSAGAAWVAGSSSSNTAAPHQAVEITYNSGGQAKSIGAVIHNKDVSMITGVDGRVLLLPNEISAVVKYASDEKFATAALILPNITPQCTRHSPITSTDLMGVNEVCPLY